MSLIVAAVLYGWAAGHTALEPYYEASVRTMASSWHNFAFGAVDPAGTISLDKLPGAFWVQALSVRVFGFHGWSMALPQAVEGVLTIAVLYWVVGRLAGPTAGVLAAGLLALTPAAVGLNRGNISDSLMIFLLVLAAAAVVAAVSSGRWTPVILAGVCVGLAFQAKMIEAWLILPALGLTYLLQGPGGLGRRVWQVAAGGLVAGVVSMAWMVAISLVPAGHRPYVDGSHHNSIFDQVFVYNGFGRLGEQTPLQLLAGQNLHLNTARPTSPGIARLLHGDLGRDIGWLLPLAVAAVIWGILDRRGAARGDGPRTCFVLWGSWLLILGVAFSAGTAVLPYYTAALAPAIAAILGAAVALAAQRTSPEAEAEAIVAEGGNPVVARDAPAPAAGGADLGMSRSRSWRIGLAVVVAASVAWAVVLVPGQGAHRPGWLVPLLVVAGIAATLLIVSSALTPRPVVLTAALAGGLLAVSCAPAVASVESAAHHQSAFDTPFEPRAEAAGIADTFVTVPATVARLIPRLEAIQRGAPYLLATQTAVVASVFILASGDEALPIGGFTGTMPEPTLAQLQADVRTGRFHLAMLGSGNDPRLAWIAGHCLPGGTRAGLRSFYCLPTSAASGVARPTPARNPSPTVPRVG